MMKKTLLIGFFFFTVFCHGYQKGMGYVTFGDPTYDSPQSLQSLKNMSSIGVEWVSIVITWYQDTEESTNIYPISGRTPSDEAVSSAVRTAQSLGMKIMLKPHVDPANGVWRGYIGKNFDTSQWNAWFASYRNFISSYAELADELGVQQLSVGVEFQTASPQEAYWREIVAQVRRLFSGTLTYCANWGGDIDNLRWADTLDVLGVDAYYPLTDSYQPSYNQLLDGWQQWFQHLKNLSSFWKKQMIFTEVGFKSINGAAITPSDYSKDGPVNNTQQVICFQSVLDTFIHQNWWGGVYWWAWQTDPNFGAENPKDYTPQEKPAQDLLRKYYS